MGSGARRRTGRKATVLRCISVASTLYEPHIRPRTCLTSFPFSWSPYSVTFLVAYTPSMGACAERHSRDEAKLSTVQPIRASLAER
jgi:hypothetical protein